MIPDASSDDPDTHHKPRYGPTHRLYGHLVVLRRRSTSRTFIISGPIIRNCSQTAATANGIELVWNQARHAKRQRLPKHHFHLFLKECEWRFNEGSPKQACQPTDGSNWQERYLGRPIVFICVRHQNMGLFAVVPLCWTAWQRVKVVPVLIHAAKIVFITSCCWVEPWGYVGKPSGGIVTLTDW